MHIFSHDESSLLCQFWKDQKTPNHICDTDSNQDPQCTHVAGVFGLTVGGRYPSTESCACATWQRDD